MNIPTPGLFPSGDIKKDGFALFAKFVRTKDVDAMEENYQKTSRQDKIKLQKCLTVLDLTSLGVGSCVGTGMYLVSGLVAQTYAGPAVVFSFVIAAVASILSGACYAEFGVRVPHTTGSAYMYSYVTVGELIAFVIGWNMILEYLIGTAACACALSACFNSLTKGAIDESVKDVIGSTFGHTPDVLAFIITLLMMVVLALGVKKSLIFNNVLNVINFAAWVFIMSAGLFYVRLENWSNFLPRGWSGVFEGAATCFYAFIGFDIIATTGEEAHNPKKSIPLAIILSLVIILIAYVTSSMMLTLIIPVDEISVNSALVAMFGQVGAFKCQIIVAIGALAGLTVSMFGSMFPMPRIIYAMAQDGLIFRYLSQLFPLTGTPLIATAVSGVAAAIAALFLNLQILVEMMSIGTLLAYTLVSTCVLILRYQPHSTNLMGLLPETLRTPIKGSPIKEPIANGQIMFDKEHNPEQIKKALGLPTSGSTSPYQNPGQKTPSPNRKVIVRRITRSSPDSDSYDEETEDYGNDSQRLVTDKRDKKHYGTTLHKITPVPKSIEEKVSERMENVKKRLQILTYLCPALFPWVDPGPVTDESGKTVLKFVSLLYVLISFFDAIMVYASRPFSTLLNLIVFALICAIIAIVGAISRKPQNKKSLVFLTPGVPLVPVIAIMVNIYLILNLSVLTLVRFVVWMTIGFIIYFYYGIKNSTLEQEESAEDQTIVPATNTTPQVQVTQQKVTEVSEKPKPKAPVPVAKKVVNEPTQPTRPTTLDPPKSSNKTDLFVSPSAFPKWDD
ncbi:cationic amino acid transporter 2 [Planococcus citri]|uniref:cationic amino acid transporter 2 n=1 Tax=Planococcus citri TaxID=170843 RepID=UPI0031FA1841